MIRGVFNTHTLLYTSLQNQVTRALSTGPAPSTGNASADVDQSTSAPQAGITRRRQAYTPKPARPKLRDLSNDDVHRLLDDLQQDLTPPTPSPEEENGGLDASISKDTTLSNIFDMPLSPLMHPKLIGARKRYLEAKQLPNKDPTEFETLLNNNSYAILLTSPIRRCIVTGNRLPSSMLLQFSVTKHTRTQDPWISFQDVRAKRVVIDRPSAESTEETAEPDAEDLENEHDPVDQTDEFTATEPATDEITATGPATHEITAARSAPTSDVPLYKPTSDIRPGTGPSPPHFYITASYSLVAYWTSLRKRQIIYSLPGNLKRALASHVQDLVVREDMADYILGRLRNELVRSLQFLADFMTSSRGYMTGGNDAEFAGTVRQAAAVLVLGGSELCKEVSTEMEAVKAAKVREGKEGRAIPVYDLREMFGEEAFKQLREGGKGYAETVLGNEIVVLRRKRRTVTLIQELWKLRGYMHGMERIIRNENGRKLRVTKVP